MESGRKSYRTIPILHFQLPETFVSPCAELEILCDTIFLLPLVMSKNGFP